MPAADANADLSADAPVRHRRVGDVLVVEPAVDLTAATTNDVRSAVLDLLAEAPTRRVVFNLRHVTLCDSSGVAVFIETLGRLNAAPGSGALWAVETAERVRGMIEICRLTTIVRLGATEAEAIDAG